MVALVKQSVAFLLLGIAWIILSDVLLYYTCRNNLQLYYQLQVAKGILFITLASVFIHFSTRRMGSSVAKARSEVKLTNSQMAAMLKEKVRYQKEMIQAIIATQEEERSQLGKELHDNVSQILATIKLYLDIAKENPVMREELINKSSGHVTDVITELRKLSKILSPPAQEDISLIASIEDLLQSKCRDELLEVEFTSAEFQEENVTPDKRIVIYRIIHEQLNNIIRYAHAKYVSVLLKHDSGNTIFLQIHNDGNNFESNTAALNNIRNRAELIDGSLQVISDPVKGCTIQVTL